MATYNKDKIKIILLKKYKNKIKPNVLEQHIDGLVNEYIDNKNFISKNRLKVASLPTKEDIASWFEDELDPNELIKSENDDDPIAKIDISKIYTDKIAKQVFKHLYDYKWEHNKELNDTIKILVHLYKISEATTNEINKDKIISRLINIALIGTIRFYKLERTPYLRDSQIKYIINKFFKILSLLFNLTSGKYKSKKVKGELYIFKLLNDSKIEDEDD